MGSDFCRFATYVTTIQDTTNTGVKFPAGITATTALDGMTVLGLGGNIATSAAITVTNSSPSQLTVTGTGRQTTNSFGLNIIATNGRVASPTVANGTYTASATGASRMPQRRAGQSGALRGALWQHDVPRDKQRHS